MRYYNCQPRSDRECNSAILVYWCLGWDYDLDLTFFNFQNLGTALITMAAGTIVDEYGYDWLEVSTISSNVSKYISKNFYKVFSTKTTDVCRD